jgi:hypothetical protein
MARAEIRVSSWFRHQAMLEAPTWRHQTPDDPQAASLWASGLLPKRSMAVSERNVWTSRQQVTDPTDKSGVRRQPAYVSYDHNPSTSVFDSADWYRGNPDKVFWGWQIVIWHTLWKPLCSYVALMIASTLICCIDDPRTLTGRK